MLFGHLSLLLFGLYDATFLAEILHSAVEDAVLAELALQRSVVHGNLDRRLQADSLEALLTIAQHPSLVTHEGVLQTLAYHLVGIEQIWSRDTFAIRRVYYENALLGRLCEVLEVGTIDGNVVGKTSSTHVKTSCVDCLHVDVVTIDMVCKLTFLRVVIIDSIEKLSIVIRPLLESELLAEHARTHVMGNKSSLDGECARTTHRVNEVGLAMPSGHKNHTSSKHLVERSLY